jgi:hypothetical protein
VQGLAAADKGVYRNAGERVSVGSAEPPAEPAGMSTGTDNAPPKPRLAPPASLLGVTPVVDTLGDMPWIFTLESKKRHEWRVFGNLSCAYRH